MRSELYQPALDPTQNIPFNLSLTASQQESRARVPLPYAHEGKLLNRKDLDMPDIYPGQPTDRSPGDKLGAILYDPDSADDIDDDDPDEDLDI